MRVDCDQRRVFCDDRTNWVNRSVSKFHSDVKVVTDLQSWECTLVYYMRFSSSRYSVGWGHSLVRKQALGNLKCRYGVQRQSFTSETNLFALFCSPSKSCFFVFFFVGSDSWAPSQVTEPFFIFHPQNEPVLNRAKSRFRDSRDIH